MKFLPPVGGLTNCHGILTAPNHKGIPAGIVAGLEWAADAGCLVGPDYVKKIDFEQTIKWLQGPMLPYKNHCLFVAGFDVVGNAQDTLDAYHEFKPYFDGWPLAYVAQNGAENLPIPEDCAAVFIGGNTAWKCSMVAVSVIKRAQALGKHIHVGRVNWRKRYRIFRVLVGSDYFTCDGTRPRYDGIKKTLRDWKDYEAQPPLFGI